MSGWQPPGHPYQVRTAGTEISSNHSDSPRSSSVRSSIQNSHQYYPQIAPPAYYNSASSVNLSHQPSGSSADGYAYVDQHGALQSVPVVSRQQVLRELAYKPPTRITGVQLQEGADASPHRARQSSTATTSSEAAAAAAANGHRKSALQHWLVPDTQQRYWAIWTSVFTVSAAFIFAFMAGNFAVYQQSPTYSQYHSGSQTPVQVTWGPRSLEQWLRFWQATPFNTFDVGYLMNWGARWVWQQAAGPDGSRRPQAPSSAHHAQQAAGGPACHRAVLTAVVVGQALQLGLVPHASWVWCHMPQTLPTQQSCPALTVPLCDCVTHTSQTGTSQPSVLGSGGACSPPCACTAASLTCSATCWFSWCWQCHWSTGFGGTFMSMAFEDPCFVYVGASGAVFGFIGLYLTDIILNFESMYRPLLRLMLMLVSLGLTLGIEFWAAARNPLQRISHMSHLGGLAAGLFVSFMFLPNLADRRWKAARKLAARVSITLHTRLSFGGAPAPLPVDHQVAGESCWRRNAWLYYLVWLVSACVMLFLFVGLPVYVYVVRMPNLTCTPLVQGGL